MKDKIKYQINCTCGKEFTGITYEPSPVVLEIGEYKFSAIQLDSKQKSYEVPGKTSDKQVMFECPNCQKENILKRKRPN